jgi:hypothetical protein
MKKLLAASLLMLGINLLVIEGRASAVVFNNFSNFTYSGRVACAGGVLVDASASWVVMPDGKGGYIAGQQCLNTNTVKGPCEYIFTLDTAKSKYNVDSFGIVHEELDWLATSQGTSTFPNNYTDHVGSALFGANPLSGFRSTGTHFTDDNMGDQGSSNIEGRGICNR